MQHSHLPFSEQAFATAAADPRVRVVWMEPADFLQLAAAGGALRKQVRACIALHQLGEWHDLPYLRWRMNDDATAQVVSHEGRHRCRLLQAAGIEQVPVQLIKQNTIEGEPQELFGQDGQHSLPFPQEECPEQSERHSRFAWHGKDVEHHPDSEKAWTDERYLDRKKVTPPKSEIFKENEQVSAANHQSFAAHRRTFNAGERSAIEDYQFESNDLNTRLRRRKPLNADDRADHARLEHVTSHRLKTSMHVWRGGAVDPRHFPVGHEFTDHGYTSTSPKQNVAESFGDTLFHLHLPRGTKAQQLHNPKKDDMHEILLHHGTTFKVTRHGIQKGNYGAVKHVIHARVIRQKESTEPRCTEERSAMETAKFSPGDPVTGEWPMDRGWYSADYVRQHSDGTHTIRWRDTKQEHRLAADKVRGADRTGGPASKLGHFPLTNKPGALGQHLRNAYRTDWIGIRHAKPKLGEHVDFHTHAISPESHAALRRHLMSTKPWQPAPAEKHATHHIERWTNGVGGEMQLYRPKGEGRHFAVAGGNRLFDHANDAEKAQLQAAAERVHTLMRTEQATVETAWALVLQDPDFALIQQLSTPVLQCLSEALQSSMGNTDPMRIVMEGILRTRAADAPTTLIDMVGNRTQVDPQTGVATPVPGPTEQAADEQTHRVPEAVKRAAQRGLDLRKKHGRGGIGPGQRRAGQLVSGKPMRHATVLRMHRYFTRHAVDKQGKDWDNTERPSNGKIAWLLWGGDPGASWARGIAQRHAEQAVLSLPETALLTEHYPINHVTDKGGFHEYKFKSPHSGIVYKTQIIHGPAKGTGSTENDGAHVTFNPVDTDSYYGVSNAEGKHAHRVLSTVKENLRQHLARYPHLKTVHFSSDNNDGRKEGATEGSRTRLYRHMVRSIAQHHEEHAENVGQKFFNETHFTVHRKDLKNHEQGAMSPTVTPEDAQPIVAPGDQQGAESQPGNSGNIDLAPASGNDITRWFLEEMPHEGWVERREAWWLPNTQPMILNQAYTPDGDWIGGPEDAQRLVENMGIAPELIEPGKKICQVGQSTDGQWYGWSHRAISGFPTRDEAVRFAREVSCAGWTDEDGFADSDERDSYWEQRELHPNFPEAAEEQTVTDVPPLPTLDLLRQLVEGAATYDEGETIHARYKDGKHYKATYLGMTSTGKHKIRWHDTKKTGYTDHIRRVPKPRKPAQPKPLSIPPHPIGIPSLRMPRVDAPIVTPLAPGAPDNPYNDHYRVRDGRTSALIGHIKHHGGDHYSAHHHTGVNRELPHSSLNEAVRTLHSYHQAQERMALADEEAGDSTDRSHTHEVRMNGQVLHTGSHADCQRYIRASKHGFGRTPPDSRYTAMRIAKHIAAEEALVVPKPPKPIIPKPPMPTNHAVQPEAPKPPIPPALKPPAPPKPPKPPAPPKPPMDGHAIHPEEPKPPAPPKPIIPKPPRAVAEVHAAAFLHRWITPLLATTEIADTVRPLYVCRKLLNVDDLKRWAAAQQLPPLDDDLHVTQIYSKGAADWMSVPEAPISLEVPPGGPRAVDRFGADNVVLRFNHPQLADRQNELRQAGFTTDFPDFKAHVTLFKDPDNGVDESQLEPYHGPLQFGHEYFGPVLSQEQIDSKRGRTATARIEAAAAQVAAQFKRA